MSKRRKHYKPAAGFANGLLEAVASASGAGWFSDAQQKRLRCIIREEFSDLADAGLIYDDVQLDQFEHTSEITNFPQGGRPNHTSEEEVSGPVDDDTDDTDAGIEVEEVTISPPICECSSPSIHPNCRVISVE